MDQHDLKNASDLKGRTGIIRLLNAYRYSASGFSAVFHKEQAFRQECYIAFVLVPLTFFLPVDIFLQLLCIISLLGVLLVELLNSGIEALVDRVGLEIHPLSKLAKDAGSAAVSVSLLMALLVWAVALCVVFASYSGA